MNRKLVVCSFLSVLALQCVRAEPRDYAVDPVHSSVTFTIRHLYTYFTGRFNTFSGTVTMDPQDLSSLKVTGEVDILGIDTANSDRDKHLRTPDFFDTQRFPKARFESTKVTPQADGKTAVVLGNLTLRDRTREVSMRMEFGGYGPAPKEERRLGFRMTGTIPRSDFGVSYNITLPNGMTVLGEDVTLTVAVEAVETVKTAPPPKE
jgi:polyisoprenoid-binding protein YceI